MIPIQEIQLDGMDGYCASWVRWVSQHLGYSPGMELQHLGSSLLGSDLALISSLLLRALFLRSGIRMCTLCHRIIEAQLRILQVLTEDTFA